MFAPDEYYIPLEKDFSNIDDVLHKFRDDSYCERLVDAAHDAVMSELTYGRLIGRFADAMEESFGLSGAQVKTQGIA